MAYRWHEQRALEDGWALLQGLNSVSSTVERLSFALEYYPFMEDYYYFNIGLDGSLMAQFRGFLKQFLRLSSVEVPISLLLGLGPHNANEVGDILQNTLHELCLHWDCSELSPNP